MKLTATQRDILTRLANGDVLTHRRGSHSWRFDQWGYFREPVISAMDEMGLLRQFYGNRCLVAEITDAGREAIGDIQATLE